ncbi:dihydrolipoyl dehydrogenase [Pseudomonas fluorescens]
MGNQIEITVPDIGDFKDVEVIEILVKPGDRVNENDSLIMLETDKAAMEVPASSSGVVKELCIQLGDKVSRGTRILVLEAEASDAVYASAVDPNPPAEPAPADSLSTTKTQSQADIECDVLVLGAGPGGYSAAFRCADLGMKTVLVERYDTLGGVCLNVGCIPSKALLHNAAVLEEAKHLADSGIVFGDPVIDISRLRGYKEEVVGKLTGGLAGMAKARKVEVVRASGSFIDAHHLEVQASDADVKRIVRFKQAIIAAGSRVTKLPFIPQDPRIVDSTGALELPFVPKRMLIIGGGIIGLEMGTVYSALGARLEVVEMLDGLMPGADRDLVKVWFGKNQHRFDRVMLKTKTVAVEPEPDGIWVTFEGNEAPADAQCYDMVLVAAGRAPNGLMISADKAGVLINERGFIPVDKQMRTNVPHIFAIGDIVGQPMLAHKAVHEAHIAAEVAHGEKAFFDARVIPSVAYTDPEVAWAGLTEEQCKSQGIAYEKGLFPWAASGRAIANGREEGFSKLLFDKATKRIIGGGIVGTHAGDLIGEVCLAIEMGADGVDIGKTIHPHPTLCESVGLAAEASLGTCTDLPPRK